jgi:hypothetical protein
MGVDKNKFRCILFTLPLPGTDDGKIQQKERLMFQVSDKASEMIKDFLKERSGPHAIRIVMSEGG